MATFEQVDDRLESEQRDLFLVIAEAYRSAPRADREFLWSRTAGGTHLHQPALPGRVAVEFNDLEVLRRFGLVSRRRGNRHSGVLNVTPDGLKFYEYLRKRQGLVVESVEATVRQLLDGSGFAAAHPGSSMKLNEATSLLWSPSVDRELSRIGHTCREAMQLFASELVARHRVEGADEDRQHTVARIRAVLAARAERVGATEQAFLDALLAYWGTVSDLVQRQEHAGQKEGSPVEVEDARRVVFQTMNLMYELHRSLG